MIKLTNIKTTDKIKLLRGQINAMQNEIMADQPFVGALVNPSINYYAVDGENATLVATNAANTVKSSLTALCFPESNSVFVAGVWGMIQTTEEPHYVVPDSTYTIVVVSVPAIRLATSGTDISTFVPCERLGLPSIGQMQGITTKPMQANIADIMFARHGSGSMVTPYIEQGDNTFNVIFNRQF